MSGPLRFERLATSSTNFARLGRVETAHGSFQTPAFMPVATAAAMKGVLPEQVSQIGAEILLNNAYHLMVRPGADLIERQGGVHSFMRWNGPILSDSGGYQAFSMADINAVDDDGVRFRSFVTGEALHLGPERSIEVQNQLGADIIMAFDDCAPSQTAVADPSSPRARLPKPRDFGARRLEAHERTLRWLDRSVAAHANRDSQALFGIIQGGTDLALRTASVQGVCSHDLPGYAIGGVAVGEGPELIQEVVQHTARLLPEEKPRYLMGVGYERDLVMAVAAGMDMFDCVLPTRNGRMASIFTSSGRIRLRNARFREDFRPIEEGCDCPACSAGFSRAYLRHCFLASEMLGPILASLHNLRHFQRLLLDIRRAIAEDSWSSLFDRWPVLNGDAASVAGNPQGEGLPLDTGGSLDT